MRAVCGSQRYKFLAEFAIYPLDAICLTARYALRGVGNLYHIATHSVISHLRSKYIALRSNISPEVAKFRFSEVLWRCTIQRLPLTRELSAKLTEGEKTKPYQYIFLSLRRKSKIFATSLIRGRLGAAVGAAISRPWHFAHKMPLPQGNITLFLLEIPIFSS